MQNLFKKEDKNIFLKYFIQEKSFGDTTFIQNSYSYLN